ncbi:RusA family crossover junction endodeoxyribonuclease [Halovulum sp. GXIMD14793]
MKAATICFVIPGKPFPKQRPRFARGRTYTPSETVAFEKMVAQLGRLKLPEPFDCPVTLEVTAYFRPPKSWSKKKAAAHLGQPHIQRPDGDNILKAISDGLNGVAFVDDAQVYSARVRKLWGDEAKTVVEVRAAA